MRVCNRPCKVPLQSVRKVPADVENLLQGMKDSTLPRAKQASKRKRRTKAVPVLGVAGCPYHKRGAHPQRRAGSRYADDAKQRTRVTKCQLGDVLCRPRQGKRRNAPTRRTAGLRLSVRWL